MMQAIIEFSVGDYFAAIVLVLSCAVVAVSAIFYCLDRSAREERIRKKVQDSVSGSGHVPKNIFRLDGKEWAATGYGTVSGFVVEAGSIVRKEAFSSLTDSLHNLRQSFVDNGILVNEEGGDELVLRTDFEFDSSTAAASFVTGRKASGPYNWKDEDGLTFGEYTQQGIPQA